MKAVNNKEARTKFLWDKFLTHKMEGLVNARPLTHVRSDHEKRALYTESVSLWTSFCQHVCFPSHRESDFEEISEGDLSEGSPQL